MSERVREREYTGRPRQADSLRELFHVGLQRDCGKSEIRRKIGD